MKETEFKRNDGTPGINYKPEAGDKVVAQFSAVGTRDNPSIVKGKAVIIKNHFLGVKYNDKDITIIITDGQKKVLDKTSDLTGKTITFEEYENDYGKQVGARVVA